MGMFLIIAGGIMFIGGMNMGDKWMNLRTGETFYQYQGKHEKKVKPYLIIVGLALCLIGFLMVQYTP